MSEGNPSPPAAPAPLGAAADTAWRRVLLIRSCRLPQFRAAVAAVRAEHPGVRVWALTNAAFADDVRAAGADAVVEHTATRLGPWTIGPALLARLRRSAFDAVVVPTMDPTLAGSANLLRLAAAIGAPRVAVSPQGGPLRPLANVRVLALMQTLRCPEPVLVLAQMLRACLTPAPTAAPPSRPHVLHIINSLGVGGAQTQCVELINRTPPEYAVSVLVLDPEPSARERLFSREVRVESLGAWSEGHTPVSAIRDYCQRGRYDIVHTWLPLANMYGSAGARLAGVPRIVTSVRSLNPGWYPQWCQWWYRAADILAARIADVVTVNATPLARDHGRWAWFPSRRIAVVPNGLDLDHREGAEGRAAASGWLRGVIGRPVPVPLIGCVGRLAIEKDQRTFLEALARLHRRGLVFHAVLVGDGPCEAELRAVADRLGLQGLVTFMGSRRDSRRIIAGLDLLVLTSTIEGFPNVLLEAALLGVPLVSSEVGGVRDLVDEPASRFAPADPDAAANAIAAALDDPTAAAARAARLQARGRSEFNTATMVNRWLALYGNHCVKPRPEPHADAWRRSCNRLPADT